LASGRLVLGASVTQLRLEGCDDLKFVPMPAGWRPDEPPVLDGITELAHDTETTGLRWWAGDRVVGRSVAWWEGDRVRSVYLPTGHRGGGNLDAAVVRRWEHEQLRGKHLDGLNEKFDVHSARESGTDLVKMGCTFGDVGLNAALLDDHRKYFNLESIARDVLGVGKVEGLDKTRIADYPAWMVAEYARRDAELVLRIKKLQLPVIRLQGLDRVYALENACIPATVEMERNAAPIDVEKLHRWIQESERRLNALHLQIAAAAGHQVNPDRHDDMVRLFRERGLESDEVTESGAPSFSDAVLARAARHDPVVALVRRAAHLADLRAKFLVPYWRDSRSDGLLRYSLNQLRCDREEGGQQGTVSGRYSSSQPVKGFGANIQQVLAVSKQLRLHCHLCEADWGRWKTSEQTRRHYAEHPEAFVVRELFVPRSGLLAAPDAKQIELRVFAHLSGSDRLAKIYADDPDTDFHAVVGDIVAAYRPDFERKRIKNLAFACVEASTPVLTADLRWIPASSAQPGDALLAFDENQQPTGHSREKARRWRVATVLGNTVEDRECVEVCLDNGEKIVSTPDHRWVAHRRLRRPENESYPKRREKGLWIRTDQLRVGDRLVKAVDVSAPEESWESGWLAGFLDGEGCASGVGISVGQNEGPTLDYAEKLLRDRYRDILKRPGRIYTSKTGVVSAHHALSLKGNVSDRLAFLVKIRPTRLLPTFVEHLTGTTFQRRSFPKVVSTRRIGLRPIAALGTSTATYIAAGYAAHNTLFGAGIKKLAAMMGVDENSARKMRRSYDQAFPEMSQTMKRAMEVAEERGYIRTILGRRVRFVQGCRCGACATFGPRYHKALNGAVQGGAADINKLKLVELYEAREELGLTLRMTVHDEAVMDVPDQDAADRMDAILQRQAVDLRVPILWSTSVGSNWAECA